MANCLLTIAALERRCASIIMGIVYIHILLSRSSNTRFHVCEHPSMTTLFTHSIQMQTVTLMVLLMLILFIVVDVFFFLLVLLLLAAVASIAR